MILRAATGRSLDALLGGEGPVWIMIVGAVAIGAIAALMTKK